MTFRDYVSEGDKEVKQVSVIETDISGIIRDIQKNIIKPNKNKDIIKDANAVISDLKAALAKINTMAIHADMI